MRIAHLLAPVLAVDEVLDHPRLQRARTEQGHQRDEILEAVRLHLRGQPPHARRFHLEDRRQLAAGEEIEDRRVVLGDRQDVEIRLGIAGVDDVHRPLDDRQRAQAEKIELDQPDLLEILHVQLGDDTLGVRHPEQGDIIRQRPRRDDDAASVLADIARQAFQQQAHVHDRAHILLLASCAQLGNRIEGVLKLGSAGGTSLHLEGGRGRDHLSDAVAETVRVAHDPGNVTHHRARRHRAIGNDLPDTVCTVLVGDVLDDPVAAFHAEVDIEVGHRDAFWIEKALEKKIVSQWIQVSYADGISDQAARAGAAPRPHRHAVVLGPLDEIGHDQEVAGEAHLLNDGQLGFQALVVILALSHTTVLSQPLVQAGLGHRAQLLSDCAALRHREIREVVRAEMQPRRAAARDLDAIGQRLRDIGEALGHLLARFQVLLGREGAAAARIVEGAPLQDADARLVGVVILATQEADIVDRHHRHRVTPRQRRRRLHMQLVLRAVAARQRQIEAVVEGGTPVAQRRFGACHVAGQQLLTDFALRAGEHDQPFRGLQQPFACRRRLGSAGALGVDARHQAHQIRQTLPVLHQHRDTPRSPFAAQPQIDAQQRLDSGALAGLVELGHGKEIVAVSERDSRLPEFRGTPRQRLQALIGALRLGRLDADRAVDEGVFAVDSEMNEAGHRSSSLRQRRTGA